MNGIELKNLRFIRHQVLHSISFVVNCITWVPHKYGLALLASASDGMISFISFNQNKWDLAQFQGHKAGITCLTCAPYSLNVLHETLLIERSCSFEVCNRRDRWIG